MSLPMVPISWLLFASLAAALIGAAVWLVVYAARRAAKARRRTARWVHFAEHCPSGSPNPDAQTYPLVSPPGPAGSLAVQADGLCIRLDTYAGRTFWLAWDAIDSLDPGPNGGAMLRVAGGIELDLSAEACRAVWDAKARVGRPRPAQPPATGRAGGFAATAS